MSKAEDVISFWLDEVGAGGWYLGGEDMDQKIRDRFEPLWQEGLEGKLCSWACDPREVLGLIILLDQFPRNMFRNSSKSFATDALARKVTKLAIARRWDMRTPEPARQFFYMPLMHSECLTDQERCVRLMLTRMPENGGSNLTHARVHREVIREFGRFPYRNTALNRSSTQPESAFISGGGYQKTLAHLGG